MQPLQSTGSASSKATNTYRRELGDGLVLRWSTPADVERVATLYAQVFRRSAEAPPNWHVPHWTRDMFSGRHPHITPYDFALVEDTRQETLVAATLLLGYACAYDGVRFAFGRPELVATLPEYRRRGLIRAIFELIHAKSEARGDLAQGITGIPFYYRQFGYEYAAALDEGFTVSFPTIPTLKPETAEPFRLREATPEDIPYVRELAARECAGALLTTVLETEYWRWAMAGMRAESVERWRVYLIVGASGRQVGYLTLAPSRWGAAVNVDGLMVETGVPFVTVVPSVLRGVRALAETTIPIRAETPPASAITFRLWRGHPLRGALGDIPFNDPAHPYDWYLRVPDLPRFVRHIAPVLERRLADSAQSGYSGELTLDFYRDGLRLEIQRGKLAVIEAWQRPPWGEATAGFPPLVFSQALFGHRAFGELQGIFPDVWAEGDAIALLEVLFPRRASALRPLD